MNCIMAYENANQPPKIAARLSPSPVSSMMSSGVTGMMIPSPMVSISTVSSTKTNASFPGARGDMIALCVGLGPTSMRLASTPSTDRVSLTLPCVAVECPATA